MIGVVDYGVGNLGSIVNMLHHMGREALICDRPESLHKAQGIILPGVGAFDVGMRNLHITGFVPVLNELALVQRRPILGICLGMQLMGQKSEEGEKAELGLSWIQGSSKRFSSESGLRVPHMGWNEVVWTRKLGGLSTDQSWRFYFAHSFYFDCEDRAAVVGITHYGENFVSSFQKQNIWGVQFHPEKSHTFGLKLMNSFVESVYA